MKRLVSILLVCALLVSVALAETEATGSCTITLVENATTGYLWDYTISDDTVLVVTDNGAAASDTELAGAPGTHSWTVTGVVAGTASITFTYAQPWENGEIGEAFIFTFAVDEALNITILDTQSNPGESDSDLIILTQYEDPASGLTWGYELNGDNVLQLAWDEYIAAENKDGTASVGGEHHWAFQAVGEGNVNVTFICLDENDEEQAVVTYEFAVQDSQAALPADSLQDSGEWPVSGEDERILLSQDEIPILKEDERILLSEDGIVILDGDGIIRLSQDDFPILSEDDIVQYPMLSEALQTASWFGDDWVPGEDEIVILSGDEFPWLEEDERILLSEEGLVILDGDETVVLSKDDLPILSEDDIVQYPMLSDALQTASEDGGPFLSLQDSDGKLISENDNLLIVPLSVEGDMSFVSEIL